MTVWYRGKYLAIVYEFGSCKTCYNYIDRLWVPVADASCSCTVAQSGNCKGRQSSPQELREPKRWLLYCKNYKETQTANNSVETRRIKFQQKLSMSEKQSPEK